MGNTNKHIKQSDFKTTHPNFNKAKLIEDKDNNHNYIEVMFKAQNKEHEQWQQSLKSANPNPNGYLLVPTKSKYSSDTGLCGNTGSLTVCLHLSRTNTPSTPSSSPNSSRRETSTIVTATSRSQNYGTLFLHSSLLSKNPGPEASN